MDLSIADYSWKEAKKLDCPYEYKLKIVSYANKTTDLIMTKIKRTINDIREGSFDGEYKPSEAEREAKRLDNVRRSIDRAKQAVHHAVRSMGADHMLTLTTRENITDKDEFYQAVARFIRLVRSKDLSNGLLTTRTEKRDWQYVGVLELQDRGAYHMHLACVGKQDLKLLRACWYVALGGSPNDKGEDSKGQIDVQHRQKRFGAASEKHQTRALVNYMTKYIMKSFEDDDTLGVNRYKRAHSIAKPIINQQFIWSSFANGGGDFTTALKEVYAIANFIGLSEMIPWNPRGSEDIFILSGVEQ